MISASEDFDAVRRHLARIRSQVPGGYCQQKATGTSTGCWCLNVGIDGATNAPCPPAMPPVLEATDVPDRERVLPLVTRVPWFPGARG